MRFLYPNTRDGLLWIGTQTGLYNYNKDTRAYRHLTTAAKRRKASPSFATIEPSPVEITPLDEQLKEKVIRVVEEHLGEADFSVEQLSDLLGMSRGHLYKRLTAITGLSPQEFIRTIRLKRGRQLLEQSGESIQQVAWRVGLSPKQFAKYFKEAYGVLPSDFIRQNTANLTNNN